MLSIQVFSLAMLPFFQRALFRYHCNPDTGRLLFLACQKLCHMLANDVPMTTPVGLNLPSEIHDLACQAATICSPGDKICNTQGLIFSGSGHTRLPNAGPRSWDCSYREKRLCLHFAKARLDIISFCGDYCFHTFPNSNDVISDH